MQHSLVPESPEAQARTRGRLAIAFRPRFFVLLLIGLAWLIPAWWNSQFAAAMFLWDLLALIGWAGEILRLPSPDSIRVERKWTDAPVLARESTLHLNISARVPVSYLHLLDAVPPSVRDQPPSFAVRLTIPNEPVSLSYSVRPRERGNVQFGNVYIRLGSWLGLAEKWAVASVSQTVCVLPDIIEAKDQALFLIRTRQVGLERRRQRKQGIGREFESLREYRQGDELRDVCWSATARRSQLITRTYEAERSQIVWIILDAGRMLRARVEQPESGLTLSKLDYAVNTSLSLAQVASQYGDRVGLMAYSRQIQATLSPGRGPSHIRSAIDCLARVYAEPKEPDHGRAARTLLQKQSRRALVIWITDFAETPSTPDVVEYAAHLARRHLVLFAAVSQPDLKKLAASTPATEAEMFQCAAALEVVQRRDLLLRQLRQCGVLALEITPGALTSSLINEYLQVKDRNLL